MPCPSGHPVPAGAKFCPECGVALADTLADQELRQITAVFCDLVRSTELSARLDAEEFGEVVQRYQERVDAVLTTHGGQVERYVGDGILIHFGWPQAFDDSAERAVQSALDIVDEIEALPAPASLAVRVGVHTGPVVVGEMGGPRRREAMALGETMNVAARLQGVADPGSVVISAATLRLVRGIFVTEDLGPQHLKGIAEPVVAHRVAQRSGVRSRLDAAKDHLTPFVGRGPELALLLDRWEQARAGSGATVVVRGEPGVGKSRLAYQLRAMLANEAHSWLEARCSSYTRYSAFQPAIQLLEQALLFAAEEDPAQRLARLRAGLDLAGVADEDAVPLLGALLAIPGAPEVPAAVSPERARRRTTALLARWTTAVAAMQPMVLLIEDLQWCDPSTLELLDELVTSAPGRPLLVLCTARPEFPERWETSSAVTVSVGPLGDAEVAELLSGLTEGATPLSPPVVERITRATDGIPLFAEEMGRMVIESGAWGEPGERLEIPATLHDSLMARLDRLSAAKRVAQLAATIGREFDQALLYEVADLDRELLDHGLAQLVGDGVLYREGEPAHAGYVFKHALIQDAAYRSLLKRTRRALHQRIAAALEARNPTGSAAHEVLAHHYEAGDLPADAISHYRLAAEHAARQSAHREAVADLRKAIELITALPDDRERVALEIDLQVALGSSVMPIRGYADPEIETAYERARELCSQSGDSRQSGYALVGIAIFSFNGGAVERGAQLAARALEIAEQEDDDDLRLLARVQLGVPRFWQGRYREAYEHAEAASRLHDRERHGWLAFRYGTDHGVAAHCVAAAALVHVGFPDRGLARNDEALALARDLGSPFNVVYALAFEAGTRWTRGEPAEAGAAADRAVALSEEQGFTDFVGMGRILRGAARAVAERDPAGLDDLLDGMAVAAQTGRRGGVPFFLWLLAEAQRSLGRTADALGVVDGALAFAAETGQAYADADLLTLGAQLKHELGHGDGAVEAQLRQAVQVAADQGDPYCGLRAAIALARLRPAAVEDVVRPLYTSFTEGFASPVLRDAADLLGEPVYHLTSSPRPVS